MALAVLGVGNADVVSVVSFGGTDDEAGYVDTVIDGDPIMYVSTSGPTNIGAGMVPDGGHNDTFIGRYGANPPAWLHRLATPADESAAHHGGVGRRTRRHFTAGVGAGASALTICSRTRAEVTGSKVSIASSGSQGIHSSLGIG